MSDPERDYAEEAMAILEGTTMLLPERAHLHALHHYWKLLLHGGLMMRDRDMQQYVRELLRKLDAEHSHQAPCQTCRWIEGQPEWQAMKGGHHDDATDDA